VVQASLVVVDVLPLLDLQVAVLVGREQVAVLGQVASLRSLFLVLLWVFQKL
jgi:hypothetical protein